MRLELELCAGELRSARNAMAATGPPILAGLVFSGLAVGGTAAVVLPLAGRSAPKINM